MPHILIVEGNPKAGADASREATGRASAEGYAEALAACRDGLTFGFDRPYFPEGSTEAPEDYDAMVVTGSGVEWSAADERARPFWRLYERAFAAGKPVLGSCWGMQNAAVVLGGETKAGPNGVEAGVARAITPTDHPFHAGRAGPFDALCMHRDDVTRPPEGALVTASNAHTGVQAMVYERGGADFWGVQFHPEVTLADVAFWISRGAGPFADRDRADTIAAFRAAEGDPEAAEAAGLGPDILDRATHLTELRNWLNAKFPA